MKVLSTLATACLLLVLPSIGHAASVTWSLDSVFFTDGTAVTGHFTLDDSATNFIGDINIVTTDGFRSGQTYTDENVTFEQAYFNGIVLAVGNNVLELYAQGTLFDLNGAPQVPSPSLFLNSSGNAMVPLSSEHDFGSSTGLRNVAQGVIVATPVPEPATVVLTVAGLGLLGACRYRQEKRYSR